LRSTLPSSRENQHSSPYPYLWVIERSPLGLGILTAPVIEAVDHCSNTGPSLHQESTERSGDRGGVLPETVAGRDAGSEPPWMGSRRVSGGTPPLSPRQHGANPPEWRCNPWLLQIIWRQALRIATSRAGPSYSSLKLSASGWNGRSLRTWTTRCSSIVASPLPSAAPISSTVSPSGS